MKTCFDSYWKQFMDVNPYFEGVPKIVDCLVIGAGYTGLTCAIELSNKFPYVHVIDAMTPFSGASYKNAGTVNPGFSVSPQQLFRVYGADKGKIMWELSLLAIKDLKAKLAEGGCSKFKFDGGVKLAIKESHLLNLSQYSEWMKNNLTHQTKVISKDELSDYIISNKFYGGLYDPSWGAIHVGEYCQLLMSEVKKHRINISYETEVKSIKKEGGSYEVVTSRGSCRALTVIVATNGYTTKGLRYASRYIMKIGSYIATTTPISDLDSFIKNTNLTFSTTANLKNYFRCVGDNQLLIGGRQNLSTHCDLLKTKTALQNRLTSFFPDMDYFTMSHVWGGTLGFTYSKLPYLGQFNDGTYCAIGFNGGGVALSALYGKALAKVVEQNETTILQNASHKPFPLYSNRAWILPFINLYYLCKDYFS